MSPVAIGTERAAVVRESRDWIGCPFHHGARVKGVGVDCAQLVLAVFCDALHLVPAIDPGYYPPDWFLHQGAERIRDRVLDHFLPVAVPEPGDLALFRYGRAASHSGIVVEAPDVRVVHSFSGFQVTETEVRPMSHLGSRLDGYWTLTRWVV